MKTVRAKFRVDQVTRYASHRGAIYVVLSPVTGNSGEDKAFWEATPNGKLEMTVTNQSVFDVFEPGKTFCLDFTPIDNDHA